MEKGDLTDTVFLHIQKVFYEILQQKIRFSHDVAN